MLASPSGTYTIHRYPAHLIERWSVADGREVTIRPVLPQDDAIEQSFVRRLSPESRYSRFLVGMRELTPAMLSYFTTVDYLHHLALIAETFDNDDEVQIGDARYVVEGDGSSADFAIAVADAWQHTGVGCRLMETLERGARTAGVRRLTGDVLGSNRKALDFMSRRGFAVRNNREEPRLMRVVKEL